MESGGAGGRTRRPGTLARGPCRAAPRTPAVRTRGRPQPPAQGSSVRSGAPSDARWAPAKLCRLHGRQRWPRAALGQVSPRPRPPAPPRLGSSLESRRGGPQRSGLVSLCGAQAKLDPEWEDPQP